MARKLPDGIIPNICRYCSETEIPSLYSLWAGISSISAILGRSCCVEFGYEPVYPNTFIVLVAESGTCRKSSAIRTAKKLVKLVKPPVNLLSQKMTPEALIDSLSDTTSKDDKIVVCAEGYAVADELTTLVDRNAVKSGLTNLMTNLYDCDDFEYKTRGRGKETIHNPCLSILGGTTVHWIKEALSTSSITGGFTARIMFVYLAEREKDVWWPKISQENIERREKVISDLNEVAQLQGPFGLTDEALEVFKDEYGSFNKNSELVHNPLTSGYASKRHVNLLKVCMAISASRTNSREIDKGDMYVAIQALESAEISLPRVTRAISMNETGDLIEFIYNVLKRGKIISRSDLIRATRHKVTAGQLDDIVSSIVQSGKVVKDMRDNKIIYTFID